MLLQQGEILTFPNPIHFQSIKGEDEGEESSVDIDYTLVAFARWLQEPKFRHFVHTNIYKYFCLLMECLCMIRTAVPNDEGYLRLRK